MSAAQGDYLWFVDADDFLLPNILGFLKDKAAETACDRLIVGGYQFTDRLTDEEIALKGIDAMVDFYHSIGMPASFHELGIDPTDAQIDEMARRCLEASGSALGSAKKLSLDDMIAIYRAANH